MPFARLALAALPALLLSGCAAIAPEEPPRPTDPVAFAQADALAEVNAFRTANGLAPLATEPRLVAVAGAQARAMAERNDMDHTVDGPLPERIHRFGYGYSVAAENIARGQPDFASAMAGWERSPGHRRNLLDPKVTEAGFAAARERTSGRIYWAQVFARPRAAAPEAAAAGPVLTFGGLRLPSR